MVRRLAVEASVILLDYMFCGGLLAGDISRTIVVASSAPTSKVQKLGIWCLALVGDLDGQRVAKHLIWQTVMFSEVKSQGGKVPREPEV